MKLNRPRKPKKTFADIARERERYDPATEGYGNPRQYRQAFNARMGFDEAKRILSALKFTPRQVLGVGLTATWEQIKTAFRKRALETHPDRVVLTGLSRDRATELFKEVNAAYTVLAQEFGQ